MRNDKSAIESLRLNHIELVKTEEGEKMSEKIKAHSFFECSAKTREGVRQVFEAAARAALNHSKPRVKSGCRVREKCLIL